MHETQAKTMTKTKTEDRTKPRENAGARSNGEGDTDADTIDVDASMAAQLAAALALLGALEPVSGPSVRSLAHSFIFTWLYHSSRRLALRPRGPRATSRVSPRRLTAPHPPAYTLCSRSRGPRRTRRRRLVPTLGRRAPRGTARRARWSPRSCGRWGRG